MPASKSPHQTLARAFVTRSVRMLERLTAAASTDALHSALASPSDVGALASFLSEVAPLDAGLSSVDPFAESLARGAIIKKELLAQSGGALSASQVAAVLGITRQGVDKRRIRGAVLAVPAGSGNYLYPACQFTPEGVVPGLPDLLRAFPVESPWTRLSALLAPAPALDGRTLIEALKAGDAERAQAVAAAFGEQGA